MSVFTWSKSRILQSLAASVVAATAAFAVAGQNLGGSIGQFVSPPQPYVLGSGQDVLFELSSSAPSNADHVLFQVWSDASSSIEGFAFDDKSPFVYPGEVLDSVTPGSGELQAIVRTSNDVILDTVTLPIDFDQSSGDVAGSFTNLGNRYALGSSQDVQFDITKGAGFVDHVTFHVDAHHGGSDEQPHVDADPPFVYPGEMLDQITPGRGDVTARCFDASGSQLAAYAMTVNFVQNHVPGAPNAPSDLAAADIGEGTVELTWNDNANDELGFEIQRAPSDPMNPVIDANATSFTEYTGDGGFRYRIRAFNEAGSSIWTDWTGVEVTSESDTDEIGLFVNLKDTYVVGSGADVDFVLLAGAPENVDHILFQVWSSESNSVEAAAVDGSQPFVFPGESLNNVTPGTGHVQALLRSADDIVLDMVSVAVDFVDAPPVIPDAPSNAAAKDAGNGMVSFTWTDNADNEQGFQVDRDPAFPSGEYVSLGSNIDSYSDAPGDGTYDYRVRAYNSAGESSWSSWASVTVSSTPTLPESPSQIDASDAGNGEAEITWSDNSDNEAGFELERAPAFAGGDTVMVGADATSYNDFSGNGTFSYRVRAYNAAGTSAWTTWADVEITSDDEDDSEGWTQFTPSADTRMVYVSSSQGNDSNNGLSPNQPVRTIERAYSLLRDNYPDWMLLRRGDSWSEPLGHGTGNRWMKSGRSNDERMIVGTYGNDPARPTLRPSDNVLFFSGGGGAPPTINHLAFTGFHAWAVHKDPSSGSFSGGGGSGVYIMRGGKNILFEDCHFDHCGVVVQGTSATYENIAVRRCVIERNWSTSSHAQGLYTTGVDGFLIEECVFDRNGFHDDVSGAVPTIYNHNIYIQVSTANVVIRNNIISDGSSHGLQLRSGGVCSGNLIVRNASSMSLGTGGAEGGGADPTVPLSIEAIGNVVLDGKDIGPDQPRGRAVSMNWLSSGVFADNIIANLGTGSAPMALRLSDQGDGNSNLTIRDNIVYRWGGLVRFEGDSSHLSNITFRDNDVQQDAISLLIEHNEGSNVGAVNSSNNRFHAPSGSQWFRVGGSNVTLNSWKSMVNDNSSTSTQVNYPDPNRSVASYNATQGGQSSHAAFMAEATKQSSRNWREQYTAQAVIDYIREGFGLN